MRNWYFRTLLSDLANSLVGFCSEKPAVAGFGEGPSLLGGGQWSIKPPFYLFTE